MFHPLWSDEETHKIELGEESTDFRRPIVSIYSDASMMRIGKQEKVGATTVEVLGLLYSTRCNGTYSESARVRARPSMGRHMKSVVRGCVILVWIVPISRASQDSSLHVTSSKNRSADYFCDCKATA